MNHTYLPLSEREPLEKNMHFLVALAKMKGHDSAITTEEATHIIKGSRVPGAITPITIDAFVLDRPAELFMHTTLQDGIALVGARYNIVVENTELRRQLQWRGPHDEKFDRVFESVYSMTPRQYAYTMSDEY